ncbi:hypothetical protein BLD48_05830 [Exiguobacterium sp. KRL4]|nr:hypothetical protein BLD48_05830 [Exiguobacterium sp. KRL4]
MFKLTTPGIAKSTLGTANAVVDAIQSALIARDIGITGVTASIERRFDGQHELSARVDGTDGIRAYINLPIESPVLVTTEVAPID